MRLAAVCAVYGGYDLIPPVPEGFDDCVLVTDVPVRTAWRNVVVPSDERPILAAKRPKFLPHEFTDCEASCWIDGSIHVRDGRFAALVRRRLAEHELVLWDHPEERDCCYQEAEYCWDWPRYADEPLREQVSAYRAQGMPEGFGLWAATCIARRHTPAMRALGEAWLAENRRWSIQDQVSLPFLLWRSGLTPGTFGVHQTENDLIDWMPHAHEIRTARRRIVDLEAEVIRLDGHAGALARQLKIAEERYRRLIGRRSVRAVLRLVGPVAPLLRRRARGDAGAGPRARG